MDEAKDGGVDWRVMLKPKLWSLGIGVIDPCDKPCIGYDEGPQIHQDIELCRVTGDYDKLTQIAKPIVGNDLRSQHKSDFIVMYVDKDIFMFGTSIEFAWAVQQRKPVLVVCKQGKNKVPLFAFGMCPHSMFFSNFDEMMIYLEGVNNSTGVDEKRRWYFWDYKKIYGRNI
jgi:hypothetical protein